jgi:hypothetical protein
MSFLGAPPQDEMPPDNGGTTSGEPWSFSEESPAPRRGFSSWDEDREATRYLAAETQYYIPFAQKVVDRVISQKYRALAPSYGVDVVVVAKWALSSLRVRAKRDRYLALTLVAGLVFVAAFAASWPWGVIIALLLTMTVAWGIVVRESIARVDCINTQMLRGQFDPASAPEPADQQQSERLAMVSKHRSGNLVVFKGTDAFVGSGPAISTEHVVIDVSRGKPSSSGKKNLKPAKFSNEDVHAAIMSGMKDIGLIDLHVAERLFVNGKHVHDNANILPKPKEPPASWVDYTVLKQASLHPTPDARVYVCVEMPSWQGQLVVTLFVRAVHIGGSLYIEWRFHVLRPVWRHLQDIDNIWQQPRQSLVRARCRASTSETLPALLMAVPAILHNHRVRANARKKQKRQEYAIDHGQVFDYGADRGIREEAAGLSSQHYFLSRDEVMFVLLAQERLTRILGKFLDKKNVATDQFDSQVSVIFEATHKHYNMHIGGNVTDSSIAFGKNAKATGGGDSPKE